MATQWGTIRELLDVVQAAGDAAIAVAVESVEVDAGPADDAAVQLGAVQDRIAVGVDHTRLRSAVGVHEVAAGIIDPMM